jgi:hypothetical protein
MNSTILKSVKTTTRSFFTKSPSFFAKKPLSVKMLKMLPDLPDLPQDCKNCKYSIKENNYMVCRLFKYHTVPLEEMCINYFESDSDYYNYYIDTESCRTASNLCGPDGKYFKPKK